MKQAGKVGSLASGILFVALGWTACAAFPETPATVAASSLALNPQMAWARAIVFSDAIESLPGGHSRRLDQRYYLPMRLKEAGQVWVPQERAAAFRNFAVGDTLLFEGTVEEFSRRYHVIVSDGRAVPASGETSLPGPDGLGPAESGESGASPLSAPFLEALLADAQNSLNELARASNVTVAQLIEAQDDGGRRIAEDIVADSLHGQPRGANSTAEELMVGAVLSLLRMQSALQESVQASEVPPDPEPATATEPPAEAVDVAVWDMGILSEESDQAEPAAGIPAAAEEPILAARSPAVPESPPEVPSEMAQELEPMPDIENRSVDLPAVEIQPAEPAQAERAAEVPDALSERAAQEKAAIAAKQAAEAEAARQREVARLLEERRQAQRKAAEEQQAAAQARARQLAEERAKAAALEKQAEEQMRRAEAAREKEARRQAVAEAKRLATQKQKSAAKPERPAEPSPQPEWMQPVWFDGAPDAADERVAEEKPAAVRARARQADAENLAKRKAAREKKAEAQMRRAEAARKKKAQRQATAEAKRRAAQTKKREAEPESRVDPSKQPEWMKPMGY